MEIKEGAVKYSAGTKTFPSKYSDQLQQSILIAMDDGTEERIYFDQGRMPHAALQRNERVQIIYTTNRQGKRIRQLVAHASRGQAGSPAPDFKQAPTISPEDFIALKLDIFDVVYKKVQARFPDLSAEDIRTITTSILIDGDRKNVKFKDLLSVEEELL